MQFLYYRSHGGSLFCTGFKFNAQVWVRFHRNWVRFHRNELKSCAPNSIPVETNSNPVRRTRFLRKKVSLRGFRSIHNKDDNETNTCMPQNYYDRKNFCTLNWDILKYLNCDFYLAYSKSISWSSLGHGVQLVYSPTFILFISCFYYSYC